MRPCRGVNMRWSLSHPIRSVRPFGGSERCRLCTYYFDRALRPCCDSGRRRTYQKSLKIASPRVSSEKNRIGAPVFGFLDENVFRVAGIDPELGFQSCLLKLLDRVSGTPLQRTVFRNIYLIDEMSDRRHEASDRRWGHRIADGDQPHLGTRWPTARRHRVDRGSGTSRCVIAHDDALRGRFDLDPAAGDAYRAPGLRQNFL